MQLFIKKYIEDVLDCDIVLEKPKDKMLGHFATPIAFSMAKQLKKNPIQIAQDLAKKFTDRTIFESVQAVKGFVNFKLSQNYLEQQTNNALQKGKLFAQGDNKDKKILLEFVSANPTGPLHIGHARGAICGDALARIGKYLKYDITCEYYVNDAGNQMQLLGTSLILAGKEFLLDQEVIYPDEFYRGEYLIDIAKKALKLYGDDVFDNPDKKDNLILFAKDEVLQIIVKDLQDLGVCFDSFVSEKSLYSSWDKIELQLNKNNALYMEDSKCWLNSTKYGDDANRVVVRENKIPTYLAGDIIYHDNKYKRNFDSYINIWGADHHGYISRVKASIEFLKYDSSKLEVILSQMVSLLKAGQPYKMSKRAGNVILMSDIVNEIGADSLRFVFLTKKSDTHLEFDIDILKNQDSSNPVFYINYAYARINQLFAKADKKYKDVQNSSLDSINQDTKDMIYEALLLPSILQEAFDKRDTQKVTDYLQNLSALVHRFYNTYKIIGTNDENGYLKALSMTALSIKTGLDVLGITAKEVM